MSFELIILGSSSALPTSKRSTAAHLLNMNERFFLIDCGEGTQIQLRRFRLSPARINHIFISHLHGDHVFGLFGMISSLGLMGRKAILNLYGPTALEEMIRVHLGFSGTLPFELRFHVAQEKQVIYQDSKTEVIPVRLKHRAETFGYLFREKPRLLNVDKAKIEEYGLGVADIKNIKEGRDHLLEDGTVVPNASLTLPPIRQRSYAYISDTAYLPGIAEQIRGVDLLFHEATFLEKDLGLANQTLHSTARQAALVAKAAGAGKLLLGHFSTRYKSDELFLEEARAEFPESVAVNDGDRFTVEQRRVQRD
ncbi:MAG: ribonuclease Z [Bacteroidales bacterium]|nr:ribonuclease Z [Bacteroidales bacterium]MDT8430068.1 ribonuclease Z [Bacteroidales bacterium]